MLRRLIKRIFKHKKPEALVPKIGVSEFLPRQIEVNLAEPEARDGNVTLAELVILAQLVKLSGAAKIFEIGTFDGRTTLNLALNSREDAQIFTLDLGDKELEEFSKIEHGDKKFIGKTKFGRKFDDKPEAKKITQLWGDSAKFDFSPYKNSVDLIFVDGSHQYEYLLKDSDTALYLTKSGSIILWHDYNTSWPGVTRALNELQQNDPRFKNIRHITGTSMVYLKL